MSTEKPAEAIFAAPTTRDGFKQMFAEMFAELMSNPANANMLAKTLAAASHNALLGAMAKDIRQEQKPVVIKIEYPDSWRCTIIESDNETKVDVLFEERNAAGEWQRLDLSEQQLKTAKMLVLAQSAVPGDVFFLTNSAAIEAARDTFVDQYLAEAEAEVAERGANAVAEAAGVQVIQDAAAVETREVPRKELSKHGVVVTEVVPKTA